MKPSLEERIRRLEDTVSYLSITLSEDYKKVRDISSLLKSQAIKDLIASSYKGRVPLARLAQVVNMPLRKLRAILPAELASTVKYSRTPQSQKLIRTVEFPLEWFK